MTPASPGPLPDDLGVSAEVEADAEAHDRDASWAADDSDEVHGLAEAAQELGEAPPVADDDAPAAATLRRPRERGERRGVEELALRVLRRTEREAGAPDDRLLGGALLAVLVIGALYLSIRALVLLGHPGVGRFGLWVQLLVPLIIAIATVAVYVARLRRRQIVVDVALWGLAGATVAAGFGLIIGTWGA